MENSDIENLIVEEEEPTTRVKILKDEVSPFLQLLLLGFGVFFWIAACAFCAIGSYVLTQTSSFEELTMFALGPGVILIILGVLIFVFSVIGILGAARQNIRLLQIYKIFLLATLIFEAFCGFLAAAFWPELRKQIDHRIGYAIKTYKTETSLETVDAMIDMLQRQLECCGSLSIDDWDSNDYFSCKNVEGYLSCGVPWSCCLQKDFRNRHCGLGLRKTRRKITLKDKIYTTGCMYRAFELFETNMTLIAVPALIVIGPLICGIFLTYAFIKQIKRQIKRVEDIKEPIPN